MQNTNYSVRKRIATLFFLFALVFILLSSRVFWVQFVKGADLSEKAMQNRMRDIPVESKRGIIYDRNGNELAISVSTDSIYAIPAEVISSKKQKEIAQKLALVLEMDEQKLYERITRQSSFEWIKRQVNAEKTKQLRELDLPGIGFTEESQRHYPKGTLASHILGISGVDNTGLEGVDFYYNDLVGGTKGRIVIEHDAGGRPIPEATHNYIPPTDGANLILTIDETIQYIVEREVDKVFKERNAKSAGAIVMDVKTGGILALTSRPTFDPNNYAEYPAKNRRNFIINDAYEPGSTMKIVTAAAALQENVVSSEKRYFCPGYIKVGKETIRCSDNKAHGSQVFSEMVENSCNVGFVEVGLDMGIPTYFKYLNDFGFGKPTGIDLPGEASGILVNQKNAKQIDLATMSMGQANAVTALQLINAVAAVANDGKLMQPHLVKQVIDNEGKVIKSFEPKVIKEVITPETARKLRLILEGVVANGTGKNAFIDGYRIAGKTGTAQKISPTGGYMANEYVASFIGFAPADEPQIVCVVVVDAPQGYPYYGGWVAAPPFKEIIKDSLRYLEVPLYETQKKEELVATDLVIVPDVVNLQLSEAISTMNNRGLDVKVSGTGNIVWQQTPKPHTKLKRGSQVIINLSPLHPNENSGEVTIPDLEGKSMKEVAKILADLGLHLIPEGYGLAYEQSPEPGKIVAVNSSIKVKFQPIGE